MRRSFAGGRVTVLAVLACLGQPVEAAQAAAKPTVSTTRIAYGANTAAAGSFVHDGVTLYFETYGAGQPLLLVHGNGGSIGWMAAQIDFFKGHRRVIAMDSRDQGRSSTSAGPLTYEKMADDLAALIDHLGTGPVDVVGWSDGGIEALLLGIRHPAKVRKLVAMGANLMPDAIYPETSRMVQEMIAAVPANAAATPDGRRAAKLIDLLLNEPHIDVALLKTITAPTLILAADHDVILLSHTVAMFETLPNGQLAIFPNSTHAVPFDDPATFNAVVDRFLKTPFRKTRRISDMVASFEMLSAGLPK